VAAVILFIGIGVLLALLSLAWLTRPLWRGGARLAQAEPSAAGAPAARNTALLLGVSVFVCIVAAAGYAAHGTPRALDPEARTAPDPAAGITADQIEGMVQKLATRLEQRPDDVEGWNMLGRSYAVLGRHEQAVQALRKALALRPDDPALLADLADSLAMVHSRNLDGEPARLIARALQLDPDHPKSLSLAGSHAFNRGDYALAQKHWGRLLATASDPEMAKQVQAGIDEAGRRAAAASGTPVAIPAQPPAETAAATVASITGTVTLAPALAAKARPDDTLFVFARAAEGPRMPLAILRKQVKDLPLTFTLDDSLAMSPSARLSSAQRVVVGARVSAKGEATPKPGDLQGFSAVVAPGARGLEIRISEIVATP